MTLSPSPAGFVLDPTKREVLRQETSNVQIRTTLLETSAAIFITKRAIVESSTGTHRESSVMKEWNIGQIPRKEATSPTKSYPINATGSLMTPSSSSIYYQPKPSQESSSQLRQGLSNGLLAGGVAGGLTVLIFIGLLLLAVILKRRKTGGLILAQSNTETSFDNLGFNGGRKISEYMDLSELELVRVKVTSTVKRKISAFAKEDQKTKRVSCGRLDLVEVPANTNIDDDILLTAWV